MAINITTVGDCAGNHLKMLFWGKAGTGKTRILGQAPVGETLIVSAEQGLLTLLHDPVASQHDTVEVQTAADLQGVLAYLEGSDHPYSWVCLDSITEIGESILSEALEEFKDPRQAYNAVRMSVPNVLKRLRRLPCHIIATAKSEEIEEEDKKTQKKYITGCQPDGAWKKVSKMLPYIYDHILHTEVVGGRYMVRCKPSKGLEIKNRGGRLDEFEEPDLLAMCEKIMG